MKEATRFICEYCYKEHKTKEDAERCENFHKKPDKIEHVYYKEPSSMYPESIYVQFESGDIVRYIKN